MERFHTVEGEHAEELMLTNIKQHFAKKLNVEQSSISLDKNDLGVPFLKVEETESIYPLSITHHGNYWAYSYVH